MEQVRQREPDLQLDQPVLWAGSGHDNDAADNDYFKISANGVIRHLAWNSQISARYTYSTTENSVPLLQQMLNTTSGGFAPITANTTVFDGEQKNTTLSLAWTANPTRGLDSKVYYNFYKQKSESTHVRIQSVGAELH